MPEKNLDGKVAIITGGGGGIGSATAERLALAGASVAVADIRQEAAEKVADQLVGQGLTARAFKVDMADPDQIAALDQQVADAFGSVDILVNNAANLSEPMRNADLKLLDLTVEVWDAAFAVNVRGAMLLSQHAVRRMLTQGGGVIVNVSSASALFANPSGQTAYGSTKGALNTLTRYIAGQYGKSNIRCNAVVPGLVLSDTAREAFTSEFIESVAGATTVGRASEPADIAAYVNFLVSDDSRQITGELLSIGM